MAGQSHFSGLAVAQPIEVFHVNKMFLDSTAPDKVNLSVGAYRTAEGKPWVLPVVRECEKRLAGDDSLTHEYLPVLGFEPFTQEAVKLLLGADCAAISQGRAFGVQSLSGTGALRVGADFLRNCVGCEVAYVSKPTWGNHKSIFTRAGFKEIREYRYWDQANRKLDFEGLCEDLSNAPAKSVIILHGCAHNPTGMDPTHEQWTKIGQIVKEKKLIAFFDIAYQGFASGDPNNDAWAVRHFVDAGHELLCAQSFAKNFGLYNERAGNLTLVLANKDDAAAVKSQITLLVRANYSNPPAHGARIVHMALSNPELRKMWESHIAEMSGRIRSMRQALRSRLEALGTPGGWAHVTQQIGMFSYLGVNEAQSAHMVGKHNVFLLKSGRINVCGLNEKNVDHVAKAIHDAVTTIKGNL